MKRIKEHLQDLVETTADYAELRMRLIVLKLSEQVSKVLSDFFTLLILIIVFLFALVMISVGLAKWIGYSIENEWAGFFIVGGIYILIGILLIAAKEKIIRIPILNSIVKGLFTVEKEAERKVENVEREVVEKLDNNGVEKKLAGSALE